MCICIYVYVYMYIYIYITVVRLLQGSRERERGLRAASTAGGLLERRGVDRDVHEQGGRQARHRGHRQLLQDRAMEVPAHRRGGHEHVLPQGRHRVVVLAGSARGQEEVII